MRVTTSSTTTDLDGDYGTIEGICVTCNRCQFEVEVFGTGSSSHQRAAVMLREECPWREHNFYLVDE
jgi:hypothetical protein